MAKRKGYTQIDLMWICCNLINVDRPSICLELWIVVVLIANNTYITTHKPEMGVHKLQPHIHVQN